MTLSIKTVVVSAGIATIIAVALVMAGHNDANAHDPDATMTSAAQGCGSLTKQDWTPGYVDGKAYADYHIDEYDPAIATPTGYLKIDEARRLVWFAAHIHGRPGHTECERPPTPTPMPAPEVSSTPTKPKPKLVLIGCRWPDGQEHDFSAPTSPDFHRCVLKGGELEFESYPGGKCEYVYPGFDTDE